MTYREYINEISLMIRNLAGEQVVKMSHLSDDERATMHSQSGEDRQNKHIPFSERVAAEFIHNATYKE